MEVLHDIAGEITPQAIPGHPGRACGHAWAPASARLELSFPFFLRRAAPVTGAAALMDYQCWLAGEADGHRDAGHCWACGYR